MFFFPKKKTTHDTLWFICHAFVVLVLMFSCAASLASALFAHYDYEQQAVVFGTPPGALSLIALALTTSLWFREMKCLMSDDCGPVAKKK